MAKPSEGLLNSAVNALLNTGRFSDTDGALRTVLIGLVRENPDVLDEAFFRGLDERRLNDLSSKILNAADVGADGLADIRPEKVTAIVRGVSQDFTDDALVGALDDVSDSRLKKSRFEEIFEKRAANRGRSVIGAAGRRLPASSTLLEDLVQAPDVLGRPPQVMADFDLPLTRDGKMPRGGVTAFDKPIGPDPKTRLRDLLRGKKAAGALGGSKGAAILGGAGKVLGPIDIALTAYQALSDFGQSLTSEGRYQQAAYGGIGDRLAELTSPTQRGALEESRMLRRVSAADDSQNPRISSELAGLIEADQEMLRDLKQNVRPSVTEAYAKAGLL